MILTEECNNIIVVYLLLPWQQLPYFTFFTFLLTFSLYFMACSPFLFVITIIRSILKIAII